MNRHIIIIRKRSWKIVHPRNMEYHGSLMCNRIQHAADQFMKPVQRRQRRDASAWFRRGGRLPIPAGAYWCDLMDGNFAPGRALSDVELVAALGVIPS